ASIEEVVISTIMLENAAQVQLITEAVGTPAPEFPLADIQKLQHDISRPEQFVINFDYLVRRAEGEGEGAGGAQRGAEGDVGPDRGVFGKPPPPVGLRPWPA